MKWIGRCDFQEVRELSSAKWTKHFVTGKCLTNVDNAIVIIASLQSKSTFFHNHDRLMSFPIWIYVYWWCFVHRRSCSSSWCSWDRMATTIDRVTRRPAYERLEGQLNDIRYFSHLWPRFSFNPCDSLCDTDEVRTTLGHCHCGRCPSPRPSAMASYFSENTDIKDRHTTEDE